MKPVTLCFDFDSTLSTVEGIDELAARAGILDQLAELTRLAMNGEQALEAVYQQRLALLRPNRAALDWLGQRYLDTLTPGARELIAELEQHPSIDIHIVSGGLRAALLPSAAALGLGETKVHAVDIFFTADHQYLDYDRASPLARSGGKAEMLKQLQQPGRPQVMIGDGYTDLEAKQSGAIMVAFTGVVKRQAVLDGADYELQQLTSLPALLNTIL